MKKREIEKRLNQTISEIVPDVLENILTQCEEREGLKNMNFVKEKNENKEKQESTEKKKVTMNFFKPKLVGALATVVICAFGIFGITQYQNANNAIDSIIDFDVNPSLEIKTNKNEKIIEVNALNDDGKVILEDMDLEKVDLDVGVNAIVGSMLKNGYITEAQNSVLISVKNEDVNKAKELEKRVTKEINELLSAQNIQGSVLSQMYVDDDEIERLAKENNVSEGKANLINRILKSDIKDSKGNAYTFDSLSKLSINELNLLLNSKNVVLNEVNSTGSANETSYIGKEKAKEIAFTTAGVVASDVFNLEVELDCDDGILIYEVEFDTISNEYEYDIHAKDGSIVKSSIDVNDDDRFDDDRYDDDNDDDDDDNDNDDNDDNDDDDRYDD